jgi:diadenosine tetraphosphate (Ap4A) HIT family hydrolase
MSQAGNGFELHPQLAKDCFVVGDLALDRVLLMNDANYPWLVLVPRRTGLRELYELGEADLALFWRESAEVGRRIMARFGGGKLNVAALGNQVAQLHVHHVVRHVGDAAWPRPIWGVVPGKPYGSEEAATAIEGLRQLLADTGLVVATD